MDLRIEEIAKVCGGKLVLGKEQGSEEVTSVVLDSRLAEEKGVFIATVGERVDGHSFIGQVYQKGVSLVVCEKDPEVVEARYGIPASSWGNYLLVDDCFLALKKIAGYYRSKLSIPIVGITGSVGKTSTKEMIAGVLSKKYRVLKTQGNYNNEIGVPLTLLRIRKEHTAAVVEMGISDFGEMHRLSQMVRPTVAVITNIGQCHLENLKSRDGILQAKTEIFDYMPAEGTVILNGDDDKLVSLGQVVLGSGQEVESRRVNPIFFAVKGKVADEKLPITVLAHHIESKGLHGSDAVLQIADEPGATGRNLPISVALPGEHMVINAAAAACVAGVLGLSDEEMQAGLQKVQATGGRGKLITLPRYTIIDDCYNANPVSMKAAIDLLLMADTVKIAILGDMFELGEKSDELHTEVGAYCAAKAVDKMYFVGENARFMFEGAKKNCQKEQELYYFADKEGLLEAFSKQAFQMLPQDAAILLKASHGMAFDKLLAYLEENGK